MTDKVFLSADRSAVVDEFAPGKKWRVEREEAVRLGLLKDENAPPQKRRTEAFDASKAKVAPTRKRTSRGKGRGKNADT
jgi:hypothetical protein